MFIAISLLILVACVVPASAKLAGAPAIQESAAHFGIPWNRYRLISMPELAAAAGVLAALGASARRRGRLRNGSAVDRRLGCAPQGAG